MSDVPKPPKLNGTRMSPIKGYFKSNWDNRKINADCSKREAWFWFNKGCAFKDKQRSLKETINNSDSK